jgi:hypothetical protein
MYGRLGVGSAMMGRLGFWIDKSHEFVSRSMPKKVCKWGEWVSSNKGTDELFNLRESKHDKVILDSFQIVYELKRHSYSVFVSWVSL